MAERKPVPKGIVIPDRTENFRAKTIERLDKENPEWVHVHLAKYHAEDPEYMARYGMELVRREDGEPMRAGSSFIAAKPAYVQKQEKDQGQKESYGNLLREMAKHGETEDEEAAREMRKPITMKENAKTEKDQIGTNKTKSRK